MTLPSLFDEFSCLGSVLAHGVSIRDLLESLRATLENVGFCPEISILERFQYP